MLVDSRAAKFPLGSVKSGVGRRVFLACFAKACISLIDAALGSALLEMISAYLYAVIEFLCKATGCQNAVPALLRYLLDPKTHVGLVMDGNRRYARMREKPIESGHRDGYAKMLRVVDLMGRAGCKKVTLFAFGKRNFNRSAEEVRLLMGLMEEKMAELQGLENTCGYKFRIVGDRESMDPGIGGLVNDLFAEEKHGQPASRQLTVNILFSYSSIEEYARGGSDGIGDLNVDLIVRTGGEKRLSDFLLVNASRGSLISFLDVKWPLLSEYHLVLLFVKFKLEKYLCGSP